MSDSFEKRLLGRLLRAVTYGGALAAAGCVADAGSGEDGDAATVGDGGADAGSGEDGGAAPVGDGGADVGSQLPPIPAPGACDPDDGDEFSGPCCDNIHCIDPPAGEACEASTVDNQYNLAARAGYTDLGSGSCLCGVRGPYSPEGREAYTDDEGRCCYNVIISWCTGRPLRIEGEARLARLVERADWT